MYRAPAVYRVPAAVHHVPAAATVAVHAPVAATAAVRAPVVGIAVAAVAAAVAHQVAEVAVAVVHRVEVDIVAKPSLNNTNTHVSFSIS